MQKGDLQQEIQQWRERRVSSLRGDEGWLTVVGLEWLEEGENTVGSEESSDVNLPESLPARLGSIFLERGALRFRSEAGAGVLHDEKPVTSLALTADTEGEPTVLAAGSVRFYVIKRGDRYGVRVKDRNAAARTEFHGIDYYDIDPKWRFEARFEPYQPEKKIPIANVIGITEDMTSPGALVFTVDGKEQRLDPVLESGSDELFIIFGDTTNGRETYGGGRYLYAAAPRADGRTIVDFNKSYNPPCVFTAFATCPLPPKQNKLPIAITAGEKKYDH